MDDKLTKELAEVNNNMLAIQNQIVQATVEFQNELAEYQKKDTELRKAISDAMEASGTKSFENDFVKLTYIAPSSRTGIDMDKLKLLHPEIVEEFKKVTPVKASVRIKIK